MSSTLPVPAALTVMVSTMDAVRKMVDTGVQPSATVPVCDAVAVMGVPPWGRVSVTATSPLTAAVRR